MVITHETTIEEYQAWLATNPPFSQFKAAVRKVFKIAYRAIRRVTNALSLKRKSCITGAMKCKIVMPLDYNRNAIGTHREHAAFAEWRVAIFQARIAVRRHIERHEMFDLLADTAWGSRVAGGKMSRVVANELLESVNQN